MSVSGMSEKDLLTLLSSVDGGQPAPAEGEAAVAEEYEIWKSNSTAMYSRVSEIALEWPSLTFQWLPRDNEGNATALTGTFTNDSEPESVNVIAPDAGATPDEFQVQSFPHHGEVNRARYNPHSPEYFATINARGNIFLYNAGLDAPNANPILTVEAHEENGYGLAWDPHTKGRLLSGADDGKIKLWTVNLVGQSYEEALALEAPAAVNDVCWSEKTPHEFAAACENGHVYIYRTTEGNELLETREIKAHGEPVNSLAFNPFSKFMFATVSGDTTVAIWDVRTPQVPLHVFSGHQENVTVVKWSPHIDGVLATAGQDRRVIIWDLKRIGKEQSPDDAEDAVPELLFMHGGHTAPVNDFDWHPKQTWLLGSVSEDNICQVWVPSEAALTQPVVPPMPKFLI